MGGHGGCFGVYIIDIIIRRVIAVLMNSTSLLAHHCLVLSCFASLDALVPRVLKFCVASDPAASEPRTATTATTEFAGFFYGGTCETHGTDGRCRDR